MSELSALFTYWSSTSSLVNAVPSSRVYLGVAPASRATYPYATITPIASIPTYTTGDPYIEEFTFQIDLWHTSAASLDAVTTTVNAAFDRIYITDDTVGVMRAGGFPVRYEPGDDKTTPVYRSQLVYAWMRNKSF